MRGAIAIALWLLAGAGAALSGAPTRLAAASPGPSFDCAKVTSRVNRLICASPDLARLDRILADHFENARHQGGVDGLSLAADESRWLHDVRDRCADAACLARAYRRRDEEILDLSLRAASPAAYDEARPFPAPDALLGKARALLGQACDKGFAGPTSTFPGFSPVKGFGAITSAGGWIVVREREGVGFAFFLAAPGAQMAKCRIGDVVVLPAPVAGESFLQCAMDEASHGFGVKRARDGKLLAYWSIDDSHGTVHREPLDVLGGSGRVRCQFPETGE